MSMSMISSMGNFLPKKTVVISGDVSANWVVVGEGGIIAKSTNGDTWTPTATVSGVSGKGGITSTARGVAYGQDGSGNGRWVAVGQGSVIAHSPDGNTWTPAAGSATIKGGITNAQGVAYGQDGLGNRLWVAVGATGVIAKSTDGNVWTTVAGININKGGITVQGCGVAYGKDNLGAGLWVAVGLGGLIAKSTDGNVWTPAATSTDGSKGGITDSASGVAYGKDETGAGLWVAVGYGGVIAKSTDGNVWTPAATSADGSKGGITTNGWGVAYGKDNLGAGLWVAVGDGGVIAKSTDGNVWTPAASTGGITIEGVGIAYGKDSLGGNLWVAVGGGGLIAKSTDGNVWTPAAGSATNKGGITGYGYGVAFKKILSEEEETNYSFTISPTVDASSVTILGLNYKVYTFTDTTANYYTITKSGPSSAIIYYMCVGAGGSGFVGGGGGGQFREGSVSVINPQTITLSVAPTTAAGNRGSSSTMVFSVETAKNITSLGGFAGTGVGGTSGDSVFAGGTTSSYGGGGGGAGGAGLNGSGSGGGDGGLPKKTAVAGISAVYPNTWWAAGGPGGYVAGNSYAGAGSGTNGYASGKGIFLPGYNTTIINNPNARNNTGSGGGSSSTQNTGGSGIIVLALPA